MHKRVKVLIVEDLPEDVELMQRELTRMGIRYESEVVRDAQGFERAFESFEPHIILSDHMLPRFNSIEALELRNAYAKETGVEVPFVVVSGNVGGAFGHKCIEVGADDFVSKNQLKRLGPTILLLLNKHRKRSIGDQELVSADAA